MSWRISIVELPDGEILIDGKPTDFAPPWKTEDAIRQQARDIAELEVFAEIGRQWNADSSLAKWFPLTAERVEQDAQEIAQLRADLAAAVAERDQLSARLAAIDTEIARLEADLELARIGARRYQFMWQMSPREFEAMWCQVMATCAQFDELVDAKIAARAGNGGEG